MRFQKFGGVRDEAGVEDMNSSIQNIESPVKEAAECTPTGSVNKFVFFQVRNVLRLGCIYADKSEEFALRYYIELSRRPNVPKMFRLGFANCYVYFSTNCSHLYWTSKILDHKLKSSLSTFLSSIFKMLYCKFSTEGLGLKYPFPNSSITKMI